MRKIPQISFILGLTWQVILALKLEHIIWDIGLVVAWFMSKGLIPYKDFNGGQYFPLPKILMYLVLPLFSWNPQTAVYIGLVETVAVLIVLYFTSEKIIKGKYFFWAILYFSLWEGYILGQITFDTNIFIGLILLGLGILFYYLIKRLSKKISFLFGLLTFFCFFSQQMSALPILIMLTSLSVYNLVVEKVKFQRFLKSFTIPAFLGFIAPTFVLFTWFYKIGALKGLIDETVLYYFDASRYPFTKLGQSIPDIITLLIISSPLLISIFSIKRIKNKREKWFVLTIILVIIFTSFSMIFAVLHQRRYLFTLPLISFIFPYTLYYFRQNKGVLVKIVFSFVIICQSIYFINNIFPFYKKVFQNHKIHPIYNKPYPDQPDFWAIQWIRQNTPENTKIQVLGPMLYYFESSRLPASDLTYSGLPWTYEPFDKTKEKWTQNPPQIWYVDEGLFKRFREWGYEYQADFIKEFLVKNYRKMVSFENQSVYQLIKK